MRRCQWFTYALSFLCLLFVIAKSNASPDITKSPRPTESTLSPILTPTQPLLPTATPIPTPEPLDPWQEDLRFLEEVLARFYPRHPGLEQAVADLLVKFSVLNAQEALIAFIQLVKRFGDERMIVTWDDVGYGFENTYPFRLTWFDEGLYVTETTTDYVALLDLRLVHIDHTDILTAMQAVETLISPQRLPVQAPAYLTNPGILYGLNIVSEISQGTFLFEDADGHRLSISLAPVSAEQTPADQWVSASKTFFPAPLPRAVNYWFTYVQSSQTLYVQYNRAESLKGLAFEDFVADLLDVTHRRVVNKFVLDLRENPGGDKTLNAHLFAAIYRYIAPNPNVQLFVMVGPETRGAAQQLASQLRRYTPAILVSAPTIQVPAPSSATARIRLPHSKLDLWYRAEDTQTISDTLRLVLLPKARGYLNERDPMLEAIIAITSTDSIYTDASPTAEDRLIVRPTPEPYTGTLATLSGTPRSEPWRQDLYSLTQALTELPKVHEGAFDILTEDTFEQAVAELNAAIPALEDHKVVVGMMQLLAMLDDAHTRIPYWEWEAFERTSYPLQVQWFSDGLFVTSVQPGYEDLLGLKVAQIGDIASEDALLALLARIVPHENAYGLRASSSRYLVSPVILHALGLTQDLESGRFVFQDAAETLTRYFPAMPVTDTQESWIPALAPSRQPLYLQQPEDVYYWTTYLENSQTLYFQYNVCGEMKDTPFWEFTKDRFAFMEAHAAQRLVIDLRRNDGGRIESIGPILVNLQQYPQFSQQGRLFVLIGGRTFSSAVYLASLIREQTEAIFVGEPTAQGPNFYASPQRFTLSNSGLEVQYPLVYWQSSEDDAPAIEPDIWVRLSSRDYFSGRDPVLERALAASFSFPFQSFRQPGVFDQNLKPVRVAFGMGLDILR